MFKALFNIIINLIATIIQIVLYPLNTGISAILPDVSDYILKVTNSISGMFSNLSWGLGLIPEPVLDVVGIIITLEIAKHSMYVFSHVLVKLWNLIQKLKFW